MYTDLDIQNILDNYSKCSTNLINKICNSVKSGNLNFSTKDLESYFLYVYLLNSTCEINKDLLIDKIQDICTKCSDPNYVLPNDPDNGDGSGSPDGGIITETNIPMVDEAGNRLIIE